MGTYTTNYNLFMPTVGETGWGTLVNGNFTTIDTTMKGLDTRLTAVENEVNGALSCTSITASGKITGASGTFSGAITGSTINGATITSTTFNGVTLKSSGTITVTPNSTLMGYLPLYYSNNSTLTILPPLPNGVTYTGSIKVYSTRSSGSNTFYYVNGVSTGDDNSATVIAGSTATISFTKIPYLLMGTHYDEVKYYGFTFS